MVCCIINSKLIINVIADDIDVKPNGADFALFDNLKKKVDLSREAEGTLNRYQPIRATENPYEI